MAAFVASGGMSFSMVAADRPTKARAIIRR